MYKQIFITSGMQTGIYRNQAVKMQR